MVLANRSIDIEKVHRIAEVLKTIGHPVRLQVLELLEQEEPLCVNEIQQRIGIETEQSMLSHHLIKMKDRGILTSEKRGMNVYYRLADRHILHIFDCMDSCKLF